MSLRPIKRLGQHFLVDPNTIRRILAQFDVPPDGRVIEIGPGSGALTEHLIVEHPAMTAIEIDERAIALLSERFPTLDVRHLDILEVDYASIETGSDPLWVIGNLPYNITSQILFRILESPRVVQAVVTMQKEVAERLVATPRTKAYGILSVLTQLLVRPRICFHISPNVFRPKPDVWSSTVRLDRPPEPAIAGLDIDHVRTIVRKAFGQRRKTLRNSLSEVVEETGVDVPNEWARRRAEELEPLEFVELARILTRHNDRNS